jgi:anti-sigma factor RsiW
MTVSRELIMRYHDGAVSEAEASAVEEALEHDPALLEELEAYSELGSFVRAWGEARSDRQTDIADSVMDRIRALDAPAPRIAPVHSIWPRLATWVSLGAAIAAGSVLVVRSWSAPPAMPRGFHAAVSADSVAQGALALPSAAVAPGTAPPLTPPDLSAALEEEPKEPAATIESVDFGQTNGTVFVVSTDFADTPVVWMPDDDQPDEDDENRSESL